MHIAGFICSMSVFCPKVKILISDGDGGIGGGDHVSVQAMMKVFKSETYVLLKYSIGRGNCMKWCVKCWIVEIICYHDISFNIGFTVACSM